MLRVKLTTTFPDWPLERQTPGCSGVWGNCRFFVNETVDECDAWVVYDGLPCAETTRCPPESTLLITGEPPAIHRYRPTFVKQFAAVMTCQSGLRHPRIICQQAQPWHAGVWRDQGDKARFDYDSFARMGSPTKSKLISVVCSDKQMVPGHRRRIAFVRQLHRHFGDRLDVFGRGFNPINDKWDAIAPYRYHVTLENTRLTDYWTEKLADAYLGQAYPLYFGCPNLERYFPAESFTPIDPWRATDSIRTIEQVISQQIYEERSAALRDARRLVLDCYNLFAVIAQYFQGQDSQRRPVPKITLIPEAEYRRSRTPESIRRIRAVAKRLFCREAA